MWKDELLRLLLDSNIKFCELAELERLNSMRIKGKSMVLVEPNDESQFLFVLRAVKDICAPFRIVGGMTNTLVSDEIFYGVLIRTTRIDWVEFTENREVYADCGASLGSIVLGAADRGIGGFSELVGVPGTVGGAPALRRHCPKAGALRYFGNLQRICHRGLFPYGGRLCHGEQ